jgi:hypothetical protein
MAARGRLIRRIVLVLCALIATIAIAFGVFLRWLDSQPIGSGEMQPSPDGAYRASVHEVVARDFWSGEGRHWFTFEVTGPGLDYRASTDPIPGPGFGSRSDHRVTFWDRDSRAVRFIFPDMTIRVEITRDGTTPVP